MAEWLGSALQKLLQRFESASDLIVKMKSPVITEIAGLLLFRYFSLLASKPFLQWRAFSQWIP